MDKKKLVVCAVFENAAARLPEWLAYHRVVGVGHFVLYDNGSTDDPSAVIRNAPLADRVTLIRWPQRPGRLAAYRHFIDIFAPGFEWAAFLGTDDFLLPQSNRSVLPTLEFLDLASAVLVHRRLFSPVAVQEASAELLIERHGRRSADDFPANRQVRVIARCRDLLDVTDDPNAFRVNGQVVNTAGHLAPNAAFQPLPCYQNLVVNQYRSGPQEAWLLAIHDDCAAAGGEAMAPDDILASLSRQSDTAIQEFAPAVRELLGLPPAASVPAVTLPAALPQGIRLASPPDIRVASPTDAGAVMQYTGAVIPQNTGAAMLQGAGGALLQDAGVAILQGTLAAAQPLTLAARAEPQPITLAPVIATQQPAGNSPEQRPEQPPQGGGVVQTGPVWISRGEDAQERIGGLALVFRDRSRLGEHWLAALRGAAAAAGIDPAFLTDEFDRIRNFPGAREARAACDLALAQDKA